MTAIEEMTSNFSYKISDIFKIRNLANFSNDELEKTFREHDDAIRLTEGDDSAIACSKYFDDYYIFAQGNPNVQEKSIMILSAYKIPIKFINSLASKDFVTIIGSFFEEVAENFVWKDKVTDKENPKKVIAEFAFASTIYDKKYLGFLQKYGC